MTVKPMIPKVLIRDVRSLIETARRDVARSVNSALVTLYWHIGRRIRQDVLKEKRAEYGQQIVPTLSAQLVPEYGEGYSARNLFRMVRFAEAFPDLAKVSALRTQLGWSHFVEIIAFDNELQRDFYAEMCRIERWSVRMSSAPATASEAGRDGRSGDRGSGTFANDIRERLTCRHN